MITKGETVERDKLGIGDYRYTLIGKGVRQGCIFNPVYLTSMQNTSCEMWAE